MRQAGAVAYALFCGFSLMQRDKDGGYCISHPALAVLTMLGCFAWVAAFLWFMVGFFSDLSAAALYFQISRAFRFGMEWL
jgi:hypothetical protein